MASPNTSIWSAAADSGAQVWVRGWYCARPRSVPAQIASPSLASDSTCSLGRPSARSQTSHSARSGLNRATPPPAVAAQMSWPSQTSRVGVKLGNRAALP